MKSTKALSLVVLLILCSGASHVLAQGTHVSPKMPSRTERRLERPLATFMKANDIVIRSARPMAAPPTNNLPPAISKVGFQTTTLISAGNDAALVSVLGDFNGHGKQDIASIVQDQFSHFWLSVVLSNGVLAEYES